MKKLIMTAAVVACAGIVSAQVYSANIVGYNKAVTATGLQILSVPFDTGSPATPTSIYANSLPGASKVYAWIPGPGGGYQIAEYIDFGGGVGVWSIDPDLGGAKSHWVEIPSGSFTNIISGEVEIADTVTNSVSAGLQLLSYPYPVARSVQDLGLTPAGGDKVYIWSGTGYSTISEWIDFGGGVGVWSDPSAVVPVGGGFWYEAAGSYQWIVSRPFTL